MQIISSSINIYNKHKNKINIFIVIFIYICIYTVLVSKYIDSYVKKNLHWLKTKPWFIPISGFFKTYKNSNFFNTITNNFTEYFSNILKKCINLFIKPFIYVFKTLISTVKNMSATLDKFRKMAKVIRNLFKKLVQDVVIKIENSYSALVYFNEKFKNIVNKQIAMFTLFNQFAKSTNYIFQSFFYGPIPKMANFLLNYGILMLAMLAMCLLCPIPLVGLIACPICLVCFDENTEIAMINGYQKIIDIRVGDILVDNSIVTGTLTTLSHDLDIYNINGDIVSGSHMIYLNNEWNRVEDSKEAILLNDYSKKYIYCLNTSSNLIYTKQNIYADYQETSDTTVNYNISKCVTRSLNNGECKLTKDDINNQYYWGFSGNTFIQDLGKKIKDINLNDCSINSGIHGIVKLDGSSTQLYDYNGIVVSGNQLVKEGGVWIRVRQSFLSNKIYRKEPIIYHLILTNNQLIVNNIVFSDFCETNDNGVNQIIDEYVKIYKNRQSPPHDLEFYRK